MRGDLLVVDLVFCEEDLTGGSVVILRRSRQIVCVKATLIDTVDLSPVMTMMFPHYTTQVQQHGCYFERRLSLYRSQRWSYSHVTSL